jgi:glycosyltransferase involved in cell wall biosynthesis
VTLELSVVVPTYNRSAVLERCLAALQRQAETTPPYEIIVVDDGSRDDTPARVEAVADGRVQYVRHERNRGRSATRNTGLRRARGAIVVMIDDDIIVERGYLRAHAAAHLAAGDAHVAVIGNLSFPDDVVRASNLAKYLQSRYLGHRPLSPRFGVDPDNLHARFLGSGITSLRRADLEAIGLFDEAGRSYGYEDHVLGHRLHEIGVRLLFAPDARAIHLDSVTIPWYRSKMREAGRDGLPYLRERCPEFLAETSLAALAPVDWSRDRGRQLARKLALRGLLNPAVMWALEGWARATDGIGALSSGLVYRALTAGWVMEGTRLRRGGPPLVQYGA